MQQHQFSLTSNQVQDPLVAAELEQSRIGYVQSGLAGAKFFCVTLPFPEFGIRKPSRYHRRLFQ